MNESSLGYIVRFRWRLTAEELTGCGMTSDSVHRDSRLSWKKCNFFFLEGPFSSLVSARPYHVGESFLDNSKLNYLPASPPYVISKPFVASYCPFIVLNPAHTHADLNSSHIHAQAGLELSASLLPPPLKYCSHQHERLCPVP